MNFSPEEDEVEISLDCAVETDYKAVVLTGEKQAENSFEEPERVHDEERLLSGAAEQFIYRAPGYSVNVLRIGKKK